MHAIRSAANTGDAARRAFAVLTAFALVSSGCDGSIGMTQKEGGGSDAGLPGESAPPTAEFSWAPNTPAIAQTVTFDASAATCSASPCTYTWTDETAQVVSPLGTGKILSSTFQQEGLRQINLVVTDALGRSSRAVHALRVVAGTGPSACSDGADNDSDGKTDYPTDPGCAAATDDNEADEPSGGFPTSPSDVGPTDRSVLQPVEDVLVTVDGTVIENVDVSGHIQIRASNVTVRNFRVKSSFYWAIEAESGTNILIEDGEIDGNDEMHDAMRGANFTARRLYIHNLAGDAFKADGNNVIESCYVTALGQGVDAHGDGVQMMGGGNIQILRNNFLLTTGSLTACIFPGGGGFIPGVRVEGNRLEGGAYTIYCNSEMQVLKNVFGRGYVYGISTDTCASWSGNTWADTQEPAVP